MSAIEMQTPGRDASDVLVEADFGVVLGVGGVLLRAGWRCRR